MQISFLGGGNMAQALIGGLIRQGHPADSIHVIEPQGEARTQLADRFAVCVCATPEREALSADALVLAVKPQVMSGALGSLPPRPSDQLVISVAAGLPTDTLVRWLHGHRRLVRAMPNTPALIAAGVTGLFATADVDTRDRDWATRLFGAVGTTVWVEAEELIDVVTAVSGSGPAYVFRFIEALESAGRHFGLSSEVAALLARATVEGAGKLAAGSAESAGTLRERVTSRGGTTEAALACLEQAGFGALLEDAVGAALERGRSLARELDPHAHGDRSC